MAEPKVGIYIVHGNHSYESKHDLKKMEIIEVTKTSIAYKFLDNGGGSVFRSSRVRFDQDFVIVETL